MSVLRPPGPLQRQKLPRRRRRMFVARRRRRPLRWQVRLVLGSIAAVVAFIVWAVLARQFAPHANTGLKRFDAIIVLGYPADADGNPTPEQLARVSEAVHEYERGVAPRLIVSGAAAHNGFVEAEVMARTARAQGIPDSAVVVEPQALDTIQNACYSVRIMQQQGWRSAEVVSSEAHLPRAGLIFSHLPVDWRTHAAPPMGEPSELRTAVEEAVETVKTARYLLYASWAERCQP